MSTPERTQLSGERLAERGRKAERAERMKAVAAEALEVGRGWTGPGGGADGSNDPLDAGAELATKMATAAVESGRPLKPSERRQVRRQTLDEQAGKQPAGQPQRRRPTVDEWLEAMTPSQRANVETSEPFQRMSEKAQAHVRRRRDAVDEIEEAADFEHRQWLEEQSLANIDQDASWRTAVDVDDQPLTEAERRAEADLAAASSGPLYTGDFEEVYSDDLEDGYEYGEEEDE